MADNALGPIVPPSRKIITEVEVEGKKIGITESGHLLLPNGKLYRIKAGGLTADEMSRAGFRERIATRVAKIIASEVEIENKDLKSVSIGKNHIVVDGSKKIIDVTLESKIEKTSKLLTEAKEYTVKASKELNHKQKMTAVKVIGAALAVLFSPVFILIGLLAISTAAIGHALYESYSITQEDSLVKANKEMKAGEELAKLTSMRAYSSKAREGVDNDAYVGKITTKLSDKLNDTDRLRGIKVERYLHNHLALRKDYNDIKKEIPNLLVGRTPEERKPHLEKLEISEEEFQAIVSRAKSEIPADTEAVKAAAKEFTESMKKFMETLSETSGEVPLEANQKIIAAFREILQAKAYQALKQDPTDPAIKFLHGFAAGIWNGVQAMDSYKSFGEAALRHVKELENQEISHVLEESVEAVHQQLLTDHGIPAKLLYAATHPKQSLGSMASEGGVLRSMAGVFGHDVYDSHGTLSNNPSLQGFTLGTLGEENVRIDNVYGGSPTIGDDRIGPEFLALIQGAENNQFAKEEDRDVNIPDCVIYNNFQDLGKKGGENPRSVTIMKLNAQFPLAFKGITLSKDSEFYKMIKRDNLTWLGSDKFGEEMYNHLRDFSSYSLENRTKGSENEGQGFYFPDPKEYWKPIFRAVIAEANEAFKNKAATTDSKEAYEIRGAYQEFVYNSLQKYLEVKIAQELVYRGVKDPRIHSQRACKENIDRGGIANAIYLWLSLAAGNVKENLDMIVGALHSRALAARDRAILQHRLPQSFALTKHTTPEEFKKHQTNLYRGQGIDWKDEGFVPAVSQKPSI